MAQKTDTASPFADLYEAQTTAAAEIANAALNGMQRLQRLTLQAMRAGAGGQLSLAQSMSAGRDGRRSLTDAAGPAAEQSARYQREIVQAIADMNNDIVRASYSMMERMRNALGAATPGSMSIASLPGISASSAELPNPMAMVDSAMHQWQTAMQRMMEAPAVASAVATSGVSERPRAGARETSVPRKTKRPAKRTAQRKASERSR